MLYIHLKGVCFDTEKVATDKNGDVCKQYLPENCGFYDDEDFKSRKHCCSCGGGNIPTGTFKSKHFFINLVNFYNERLNT